MPKEISEDFIQKNNPKLKRVSKQIHQVTPGVKGIWRKMLTLMRRHGALGIAAPELGQNICLLTLRDEKKIITMINPVVVYKDSETCEDIEKCFSIDAANTSFVVKRPKSITVEWTNLDGELNSAGFAYSRARVILHCIDHFNGVLVNE